MHFVPTLRKLSLRNVQLSDGLAFVKNLNRVEELLFYKVKLPFYCVDPLFKQSKFKKVSFVNCDMDELTAFRVV